MKIYLFPDGKAVATSVGRGCEIIPAVSGTLLLDGHIVPVTDGRASLPPLRQEAVSTPVAVSAQIVTDSGEWRVFNLASLRGKATATDATADLVRLCYEYAQTAATVEALDQRVAALEGKKKTALNALFKI